MNSWKQTILNIDASIKDAVVNLDESGLQIVLVTDNKRLVGTVSDGDIRRGILGGINLDDNISKIIDGPPMTVLSNTSRNEAVILMQNNKIKHLPIVNDNNELLGLHLLDSESYEPAMNNSIIIMAGGMGKRMLPFTKDLPKPMLKVHGKPMLEHIIQKAKKEGFSKFYISINYLGNVIKDYFGIGKDLNVEIKYITEDKQLGTAGALSLLPSQKDPIIVTNGDIISNIGFKDILSFHEHNNADATMAIRPHEWQNPFGVVEVQGIEIKAFKEKPITRTFINAGVYAINPASLGLLDQNEYLDMPNFFEKIRKDNKKVIAYPTHESWSDIGRPEDLQFQNNTNNTN